MVEGYIDAIAVSEAGFPNVVAPLGTALTPDQCALLWAMAGEPILCFDGDGAGRRAAFRAIETALPLIGPGKSLRFALLPEGQDPDDLIRLSGPAAMAEHLKDARPLADMLFMRETDEQSFDTPEQRAALERRLGEAVGKIADEPLRRHYQADMKRRLSAFFGDERERPARGYSNAKQAFVPAARRAVPNARTPHGRRRSALGAAKQARTQGAPAGARDHDPLDCVEPPGADREPFRGTGGDRIHGAGVNALRDALLAAPADALISSTALAEWLNGAGRGQDRERILALAAKMPNWWCMRPDAAPSDADLVLRQSLALHRRAGALHRDLKLAERLLATEPSELNLARLLDIKANLADLGDWEAAIDGFGDQSGRTPAAI